MTVAKKEVIKEPETSASEEALKKQLQELQDQIALLMKVQNTPSVPKEYIDPDRDVFVVSLVRGSLNLVTEPDGKGFIYKFEYFGEEIPIKYSDLKLIVQNNKKMLNKGRFYINDEDFIRQQRLEQTFEKIISKDEMESMFKMDKDKFAKSFSKMIPTQQGMLTALLIDSIREGKEIDANIVQVISDKIEKNIYELAKESKIYEDLKGE